jgi:hypothetical protein
MKGKCRTCPAMLLCHTLQMNFKQKLTNVSPNIAVVIFSVNMQWFGVSASKKAWQQL